MEIRVAENPDDAGKGNRYPVSPYLCRKVAYWVLETVSLVSCHSLPSSSSQLANSKLSSFSVLFE